MIKKYFVSPLLIPALVLVALSWTVTGFAQLNTGKIEGTVRDKDTGAPLAGAQVTVEGTRLGNVTNVDGYYFILNAPPGLRSVTFTYTGYQRTTVADVLILAGQTMTVDGSLSSTVVELGGIVVEAEVEPLIPRDQTVTKRRLTSETIAESPTTTLEDLLILEPGVQTGGPDALGRGIRIRGGRLGEEAMVIDGVTLRNYTANVFQGGIGWVWEQELGSRSHDATPLEFSTGSVEQVDIITGGFQAEYGNAQSGIVNIVTKEGGADWRGNVRFTTDQMNPRTADYGYNQLVTSVGGPLPGIPNLYIHASGEIQGQADRFPTHADEGFRGVNQDFVDRLNESVRNDPVFGVQTPAYTLEMLEMGHQSYVNLLKRDFGGDPSIGGNYDPNSPLHQEGLFSPDNPVRVPGNWGDRTLASSKITYYPVQRFKFIGTINFSRVQNSYPNRDNGNYFMTGDINSTRMPLRDWGASYQDAPDPDTPGQLISSPTHWGPHEEDYQADGVWYANIPQAYARRTKTTNLLLGFNWDFLQTAQRSGSFHFRFTRMKTQDINTADLKDNYVRSDNTFMGWSMHDIPFQAETIPNKTFPMLGSETAKRYLSDGESYWNRNWGYENPFRQYGGEWLYWLSYFYQKEWQSNYKGDLEFQLNRRNRAKVGVQFTTFDNQLYELQNMEPNRDLANEFDYAPRMKAFYLQNRTDLGDFVFNYGLRYDSFDPVDNWGFRNDDQWGQDYFPNKINEWSPRFDVAFPVTDVSQLRFSYGVFTQLPSMSLIFSGDNPGDLEFSRTDAFEAGLSYLMTDDMVMDLVGYYKDVDGNVSEKEFFRDYYQWNAERRIRDYSTGWTNRDNGNIKGLDFTLRKRFSNNFAYNLMYTLQFSRTTGSQYLSTSYFDQFIDPATGDIFVPPDEIRPIDGDVTHELTATFNYLFPDDYQAGTLANTILKNLRVYAIFGLSSGPVAYDRVVTGADTYFMSQAEDVSWLTRRDGRPIGGVNYFRGRWVYNLDLRLSKRFNLGGTRRLSIFGEIFNALNKKLPTPYPSGYAYEYYHRDPFGGVEATWSEDLVWAQRAWFNADFDQDGVLSLEEQAKGNIANSLMGATMEKSDWGLARQIRLGVDFTF